MEAGRRKRNFAKPFMNLKLSTKMILGYIFIVLLPTITLMMLYYNQNVRWVSDQYLSNEKRSFELSANNFAQKIQQVEPLIDIFQANRDLQDYMDASNISEGAELYSYIKNIHPFFSYVRSSIKLINDVKIYKYKKTYFSLSIDIFDFDKFSGNKKILDSLGVMQGKWGYLYSESTGITATYYHNLYSKGYEEKLGFVEIELKNENLFNTFSNLNGDLYLIIEDNNQILRYSQGSFALVSAEDKSAAAITKWMNGEPSGLDVNRISTVSLDKFGLIFVYLCANTDKFKRQAVSIIILMIFLIFVLSLLYYVIYLSISRRVTALDRHIASSPANELLPLQAEEYRDEIGSLTNSYNNMIERINTLIDQAYKAELLKKDAEYYALQAQVNPHFLYNILENIRMCAESNNDSQTSDMIFILVKYLRYSLSFGKKESKLADEMEHIRNYLDIYKIRMGRKLKVSILLNTQIEDVYCPRFILQPIVENSLKHGLQGKNGGAVDITVASMDEADDVVVIRISDNGQGISSDELMALQESLTSVKTEGETANGGIGLRNVNERLILFYGAGCGLSIASEQGRGTTVTFRLLRGRHLK